MLKSTIKGTVGELKEDYEEQTQSDDVEFESWMFQQMDIKENVRKVCDKYGKSVSRTVPKHQFMYDSKHKLLFCRNAKVINSSFVF